MLGKKCLKFIKIHSDFDIEAECVYVHSFADNRKQNERKILIEKLSLIRIKMGIEEKRKIVEKEREFNNLEQAK